MPRVAVCLTTFNRVDCARISLEIMKLNWPAPWPVVHSCSNAAYEQYLEDALIRREPLPMTAGAADLLASSIEQAVARFDAEYVVHLEGDTWIFDQGVIERYVGKLEADPEAVIAASSWSIDRMAGWDRSPYLRRRIRHAARELLRPLWPNYGIKNRQTLSTQFFIAKTTPAFLEVIAALKTAPGKYLENMLYAGVVHRLGSKAIIGMPEREPVHPQYRDICEALTLYSQHVPSNAGLQREAMAAGRPLPAMPGKKETLAAARLARLGPNMKKLLESKDLAYYNPGAKRDLGTDSL
ncbi:hypothetical protein [Bordetella genomosp. 9]|uniref:Glycosyl transferase n=1 Tax=Bordetella genomosp. 9 TaxID=1416803 RepID=A0A1W6Z0U8_9BORD|nr:hypothetical protein [Bordetella genomosp. 9]ARP86814.1 hypothetical protein CAL13_11805 [Bordetella genomosp. 9]